MPSYRPRLRPISLPALGFGGALLGTAWDRMHVAAGTLFYTPPGGFRQPWWVPLEFAALFLAGGIGIARLGNPVPDARSPRRAFAELLFFSATYALTALLWKHVAVLTVLLIVLLIVRLPSLQRVGSANALPALFLVVGGPATEAWLSAAGLFSYAQADVFGIPVWLPLLYMLAVPFAVRAIEAAIWIGGVRTPSEQPA
ncbi:MAG: hypothetical protein ABR548_06250 [Actinomycetota bacterium]|nr:hypothetical protein [Actinomycetota bacterium]